MRSNFARNDFKTVELSHESSRGDLWFRRAGELLDELSRFKLEHEKQQHALAIAQRDAEIACARCETLERQLSQEQARVIAVAQHACECAILRYELEKAERERQDADVRLKAEVRCREDHEEQMRASAQRERETLTEMEAELRRLKGTCGERACRLSEETALRLQLEQQLEELRRQREHSTGTPAGMCETVEWATGACSRHGATLGSEGEVLWQELRLCRCALADQRTSVSELRRSIEEVRLTTVAEVEDAFQSRLVILQESVDDLLGALDARTHFLLVKMRAQLEACQRENRQLKEQLRIEHIAALDKRDVCKETAHVELTTALPTSSDCVRPREKTGRQLCTGMRTCLGEVQKTTHPGRSSSAFTTQAAPPLPVMIYPQGYPQPWYVVPAVTCAAGSNSNSR